MVDERIRDKKVLKIGISPCKETKSCGSIVFVYQINYRPEEGDKKFYRCRHVPALPFNLDEQDDWVEKNFKRLQQHPRHSILANQIPEVQLKRMLGQLFNTRKVNDSNLQPLRKATDVEDMYIPTVDLNTLNDEQLAQHKSKMDVLFKKNQISPGDPNYVYDKRIDFDKTGAADVKDSVWDDEEDDDEYV